MARDPTIANPLACTKGTQSHGDVVGGRKLIPTAVWGSSPPARLGMTNGFVPSIYAP
jgi:hypothetical protein